MSNNEIHIPDKKQVLKETIKHIDITEFDPRPLIESMKFMAFQARNLSRACVIYDKMLEDKNCINILCLSGSLISAGLKKVIIDLICCMIHPFQIHLANIF